MAWFNGSKAFTHFLDWGGYRYAVRWSGQMYVVARNRVEYAEIGFAFLKDAKAWVEKEAGYCR